VCNGLSRKKGESNARSEVPSKKSGKAKANRGVREVHIPHSNTVLCCAGISRTLIETFLCRGHLLISPTSLDTLIPSRCLFVAVMSGYNEQSTVL